MLSCLASLMLFILTAATAIASTPTIGIASVGGDFELAEAPSSVRNDAFESSDNVRVFLESESYIDEIEVNASRLGRYDAYADFSDPLIQPMRGVRSYLIHFDQVGNSAVRLGGSVTFEQRILGVIGRSRTLEATDAALGAPGTLYATVREGRQVEYDNPDDYDYFIWQRDGRTLFAFMQVTTKFDQIRVLTAVPEPSTILSTCVCLLVGVGSRQRS